MGVKCDTADVADGLRVVTIRLAAIAERCEDESIRYELRQSIEQLVQAVAALSGPAEPR
jgi:hypothetical protein